jgi:predicted DNA-binding transcriptional regulator YafY
VLAVVAAARRKGSVDLRQVAPTVAVSSAPLDQVLEALRAAGYAPASEGIDGQLRIERREAERVPVPVRRSFAISSGVPRDHLAATVVRLRRAETAARAARSGARRSPVDGEPVRTPGAVLNRLHEVVDAGGAVEIAYVNLEGRSSSRVVHPLLLSGGYLTAYDEESGERRTFAVSRISALAVLGEISG